MRLAIVTIRATGIFAFHDGIDTSGEYADEDRSSEHSDGLSRRTRAQRAKAGRGIVATFDEAVAGSVRDFTCVLGHGIAGRMMDEITHVLAEMG